MARELVVEQQDHAIGLADPVQLAQGRNLQAFGQAQQDEGRDQSVEGVIRELELQQVHLRQLHRASERRRPLRRPL